MKKLIAVLVFLIVVASIAFLKSPSKGDTIWVCPKDETISYIMTAEKPGKLYVETEKGNSRILRAVYGLDKADILLTIPGSTYALNHPVQGYDPDNFLIGSSNGKSSRLYIHNIKTGKDIDIKDYKGVHMPGLYQPFSPDGKWLAFGYHIGGNDGRYRVNIINRQSGSITPLRGIDTVYSNVLTWTHKGLMVFNSESGTLYKGDENGVKPVKKTGFSYLGFVTPDGDDLITLSHIGNNGMELKRHDLANNKSFVIYKKFAKLDKDEVYSMIYWHNLQYSAFSDEMTVSMNWPPVRPVYIGKDRKGKEIPVYDRKRSSLSLYGVAIWKPGVIAYMEDKNGRRPDVIRSVKMN
ncbi:MAG: hypothetical protein ACYC27_15615 [Armatimonadota bacterium]